LFDCHSNAFDRGNLITQNNKLNRCNRFHTTSGFCNLVFHHGHCAAFIIAPDTPHCDPPRAVVTSTLRCAGSAAKHASFHPIVSRRTKTLPSSTRFALPHINRPGKGLATFSSAHPQVAGNQQPAPPTSSQLNIFSAKHRTSSRENALSLPPPFELRPQPPSWLSPASKHRQSVHKAKLFNCFPSPRAPRPGCPLKRRSSPFSAAFHRHPCLLARSP